MFATRIKSIIDCCPAMQHALVKESARRGMLPETYLECLIMQDNASKVLTEDTINELDESDLVTAEDLHREERNETEWPFLAR